MSVTMRQMLEAGVHFGHQTRYWNPKMSQYIFGQRNKIHIINLEQTMVMFQNALKHVRQLSANKGTVLFVGTKRQARDIVREEAERCGSPYVDHRWLLRQGYVRPFHWAWAFLSSVYPIGRSVVVRRRAGRGIAPMWVTIGVLALSIIVSIVVVVQVFNAVFSTMSTYGSYT